MVASLNCPRCAGDIPQEAGVCPQCGLALSGTSTGSARRGLVISGRMGHTDNLVAEQTVYLDEGTLVAPPATVPPAPPAAAEPGGPSAGAAFVAPPPEAPAVPIDSSSHTHNTDGPTVPPPQSRPIPPARGNPTGPLISPGPSQLAPALELLPNESLLYQLGELYLTNKRVILLGHGGVRSAFVRDIDAAGTRTDRASLLNLITGLLFLAVSATLLFTMLSVQGTQTPVLGPYGPPILGAVALILGLFLLGRYFLWVRRTLFVSVRGHPIIELSVSNWESRIPADMDAFVNQLFHIKDQMVGEHERADQG